MVTPGNYPQPIWDTIKEIIKGGANERDLEKFEIDSKKKKKGKHGIVEAYKINPENMRLYISITRWPEHWILAESLRDENIHFVFRGEIYHKPLAKIRGVYETKLDSDNDVDLRDKLGIHRVKKEEFEIIKGMELPVENGLVIKKGLKGVVEKEFPLEDYCIEVESLHEIAKKIGDDFDFLNKEEIMKEDAKKEKLS
ncbi:MAG: hypothetical protein AB1595_04945 [bacterium]